MIVNSHLVMSQIIYKHISRQVNFKLDRLAFAYGNIKPDINNEDIGCSHTLKESLDSVNKYSQELMSNNISIKDFSRSLGIVCHFVCDFFCLYHRDGNEEKGICEHLFYELRLHSRLLTLLFKGKLKINDNDILEDSVEFIALRIEKKYNLEPKSSNKDIIYALFGAFQISQLIVCSNQLHFQQKEVNIAEKYQVNQLKVKNQL